MPNQEVVCRSGFLWVVIPMFLIQTGFVDEPRWSVEQADELIAKLCNDWLEASPSSEVI